VFQDPFSSLNPRMRVRDILADDEQYHASGRLPQYGCRGFR
jgi:ABC-type microcin C transport system duplicated ATPase subunit YejF